MSNCSTRALLIAANLYALLLNDDKRSPLGRAVWEILQQLNREKEYDSIHVVESKCKDKWAVKTEHIAERIDKAVGANGAILGAAIVLSSAFSNPRHKICFAYVASRMKNSRKKRCYASGP